MRAEKEALLKYLKNEVKEMAALGLVIIALCFYTFFYTLHLLFHISDIKLENQPKLSVAMRRVFEILAHHPNRKGTKASITSFTKR